MIGAGTAVIAAEFSFGRLVAVSDHRVYNPGQVKPSVDTVIAQTIYPEYGITVGVEIQGPAHRSVSLLVVYHINNYAFDFRKLFGHKACVKLPLISFYPCLIISVDHVPPK